MDLLREVALAADHELMMSRLNCHAFGISSIVVRRHGSGPLVRIFLTWPDHKLATNRPGDLTVGIHNHRYPLSLLPIFGDVVNVRYMRDDKGDISVYEWGFKSGVESGEPEFKHRGYALLSEFDRRPLQAVDKLGAHELHTIECHGMCAWKVIEGVAVRDETTLFTDPWFSFTPSASSIGLYGKFAGRRDVVRHVEEWIKLAGLDQ
jgi:hypothetical protein